MTKPIEYDYFSLDILQTANRFFAVLLEEVIVETPKEDIDIVYHRGIYTFSTAKQRNVFTTVCNDAKDKTIAYRYNRKPDGKE